MTPTIVQLYAALLGNVAASALTDEKLIQLAQLAAKAEQALSLVTSGQVPQHGAPSMGAPVMSMASGTMPGNPGAAGVVPVSAGGGGPAQQLGWEYAGAAPSGPVLGATPRRPAGNVPQPFNPNPGPVVETTGETVTG